MDVPCCDFKADLHNGLLVQRLMDAFRGDGKFEIQVCNACIPDAEYVMSELNVSLAKLLLTPCFEVRS